MDDANVENEDIKIESKVSPKKFYSKRPGTAGGLYGHMFEIDLLILGKVRGERYTDKFYLASNMDGVGAFDDVVTEYWKRDNKTKSITIIFYQAKRVESPKKGKVTVAKFKNPKSDNGNFYLPKYFLAYLKIREKFDGKSDDPVFEGNFNEVDVRYIIYTNAILDEQFDKERIKMIEQIDVDSNILSAKSKDKAFKLNASEAKNCDLIEMLQYVSFKERIRSLAMAIVSCICCKLNYKNMMLVDIISTYHLFLSKNVISVEKEKFKGDKGAEYRKGKINYGFLEMRHKDPLKEMLRKEIIYEYTQDVIFSEKANSGSNDRDKPNDLVLKLVKSLKSSGRPDYNIIRQLCGSVITLDKDNRKLSFSDREKLNEDEELKNNIDELRCYKFDITYELIKQELTERLEKDPLKLHIDFGNVEYNIKKPQHLINKLMELFEHNKFEKVIKIDDSMVGHGKKLTNGDIKNIGKLVGSLFIFDQEDKMLKFANDESLQFIKDLEATAGQSVSDYRFDIKVKNFPRDSLVIEDKDRANVEEFFSKLEIFVGQAIDEDLRKIIKNEMRVLFKLTANEAEESFLKIEKRATEYWRDGKYYLEKDDDFFPHLVKVNIKFDVKQPIDLFTGRDKERKDLHEVLQDDSGVVPCVACIVGLNGTGKTELSRKYVSEHSADYDGNIIWINAQNYPALVESFFTLAKNKLEINVKNFDGERKDIKAIVEDVYGFFSNRKSLFIFDNAEKLGTQNDAEKLGTQNDAKCINTFLPLSSSNHSKTYVLITSNYQKWGNRKFIVLRSFTPDEAVLLIKKALKIDDVSQENKILELAEKLQYFPLALHQAVAYIKKTDEELKILELDGGFKIDDYLLEYEKNSKELLDFPFSADSDNDDISYRKTTFTTWYTTIDKIRCCKKSGDKAIEILNVLAYCLPYNIPVKMFLKLEENEKMLVAAVQLLKTYSMVDVENGVLSVHRLVQEVTRINLANQKRGNEDREENTLRNAVGLFFDGSNQIDLFDNNLRVCNVDHVMSIWSYTIKHEQLVREFSFFPALIASQLKADLRYEEASSFGSNAFELLERILGEKHSCVLSLMNVLASILYCQGNDDDALKMYRKLEDLAEKSAAINIFPRCRPGLATKRRVGLVEQIRASNRRQYRKRWSIWCQSIKNYIGLILNRQGKHCEALEIFEELSKNRSNTMKFRGHLEHNIGMVLSHLGQLDESLIKLRVALAIKEQIPQPDNESILNTKNTIAMVLQMQRKYNDALELSREVYKGRKEIHGENHPLTLTVYGNISLYLKKLGKYDEALRISNEVNVKRKELLPNHPHTFGGILNTAEILYLLFKYDEGLAKVKEIYEKRNTFPTHFLNFMDVWYKLALGLVSQSNYDEALKELDSIHREKNMLKPADREHFDTDGMITIVRRAKHFELHFAARDGRLQEVNLLLNRRVTVDSIESKFGCTPLHLAAYKGHVDVVNALLNRGAEVNSKDKKGWTPVHYAAQGGYLNVTCALLNQGAEINVRTIDFGRTPLDIAMSCGHEDVLQILKQSQHLFDVIKDKNLSERGKVNKLERLIEEGAKITAVNDGLTTLWVAANGNHKEIVDLLLKKGADATQVTTGKGNTLLHIAAAKGCNEIVELTLKHVRDSVDSNTFRNFVNTQTTSKGNAPLHIAAQNGFLKVVKSLLECGANCNIQNKEGRTPIDLARNTDTKSVFLNQISINEE